MATRRAGLEGLEKHWLWVGCTEQVSAFRIDASRDAVAARALLATPSGILVTDG